MSYLIEFRFQGKAKKDIKELIYKINKKFNFKQNKKIIPHVTLVGPFTIKEPRREWYLLRQFNNLCNVFSIMEFKVKGFNVFKKNKVVHINIVPSEELKKFRWRLSNSLKEVFNLNSYDYNKNFNFHSTLAIDTTSENLKKIQDYAIKNYNPNFNYYISRITLIKEGRIFREYDFFQKRCFRRKEALNKDLQKITFNLLKEYTKNKTQPKKETLIQKLINYIKKMFNL
ncbi:MAG: 2'-5' RNA ligase family protein [Candidatus Nanoarchaeia archaeon]|nr:2'-5' RNA ligase family protein [Candidatus Nanoarchaeia archaeon]